MSYQALLFCPDDKTARVVTEVLSELDFTVDLCNEPFAAVKKLMAQHFDALVVDCDNEQNSALLFKSARNSGSNQSSLAVAVVEGQAGVAKAFRIGANLVLTKPINVEQSKGTLRVARGLLRKADSTKPVAGAGTEAKASPAIAELARPTAPVKPLVAAFTTKAPAATTAPVPGAGGFERDVDAGPKPEPTEAAMLESMHDPISMADTATHVTPGKDSPWQPVSKLAEPMASALRQAAEAATKPSSSEASAEAPTWGPPTEAAKEQRPFAGSIGGHGFASAPAPAKEDWKPAHPPEFQLPKAEERIIGNSPAAKSESFSQKGSVIPVEAPRIEPPSFAALAVKDHEETEGGGKKSFVLIAVVVLAAIFTGYVGYQKIHVSGGQPASQVASPTKTNQLPVVNATPAQPAPEISQEIDMPEPRTVESAKKEVSDVTVSKPSAAIHNSEPADTTTVPPAEPHPIVVKNNTRALAKATEPDMAPPQAIAMPTDNSALSGIVAVTPAAVAKPTMTRLKVSQGISQGLLMKRVQPVYPPQALQMRIEGTVLLDANIAKDGHISNVKVLKGDSILAKAAMDAVKQWRYNPYFLNGEPVEIQTQVSVSFKLP